jgi:biopolymer transport protein ExbD/biopolymer transport protein TolR
VAFGRLERNPGAQPMSDINMTPLIDVMLVLLVIFMITAPLMTSSLKLDLPKTDAAQPSDTPQFISVALDRDGRYFYGEERSTRRRSRRASPPPRRRIRRPKCSCAPTRRCLTGASPS